MILKLATMATSSKKSRYSSKFRKDWQKEFSWAQPSKRGQYFCHCSVCKSDFCIDHGGKNDLTRHHNSSKHQSILKEEASNTKIQQHFVTNSDIDKVITLSCSCCYYLVCDSLNYNDANAIHFHHFYCIMVAVHSLYSLN